jgi:hypothetical protein
MNLKKSSFYKEVSSNSATPSIPILENWICLACASLSFLATPSFLTLSMKKCQFTPNHLGDHFETFSIPPFYLAPTENVTLHSIEIKDHL